MTIYLHYTGSAGERLHNPFSSSDLGAADTLRIVSAEKSECLQAFAGMFCGKAADGILIFKGKVLVWE